MITRNMCEMDFAPDHRNPRWTPNPNPKGITNLASELKSEQRAAGTLQSSNPNVLVLREVLERVRAGTSARRLQAFTGHFVRAS